MRNHFNGKTIESVTCSDLGKQSEYGPGPDWIELRFTDGKTVRMFVVGNDHDGIDVYEVDTDLKDWGHIHSRTDKDHPWNNEGRL